MPLAPTLLTSKAIRATLLRAEPKAMTSMSTMCTETALTLPLRSLTTPESKLTLRMKMTMPLILGIGFVRRNAGDVNSLEVFCGGDVSDVIRIVSDQVIRTKLRRQRVGQQMKKSAVVFILSALTLVGAQISRSAKRVGSPAMRSGCTKISMSFFSKSVTPRNVQVDGAAVRSSTEAYCEGM